MVCWGLYDRGTEWIGVIGHTGDVIGHTDGVIGHTGGMVGTCVLWLEFKGSWEKISRDKCKSFGEIWGHVTGSYATGRILRDYGPLRTNGYSPNPDSTSINMGVSSQVKGSNFYSLLPYYHCDPADLIIGVLTCRSQLLGYKSENLHKHHIQVS